MFFTTKQVAGIFGKSESWVYNKCREIGIIPKKLHSETAANGFINGYTQKQVDLIGQSLAKVKNVMVIEINYWIRESKGNFVEIEYLSKEKWEK